jgi:hypothetical protein
MYNTVKQQLNTQKELNNEVSSTHIIKQYPALMLLHKNKTKANVYSANNGSLFSQYSVDKWDLLKVKNIFT